MALKLAHISLVIDDYDKALKYYTEVLDFYLIEDTLLSPSKRWLVVSPRRDGSCSLLLAKADGKVQESRIGNQTGGRVFLFLHTDNFKEYFEMLVSKKVEIVRAPSVEEYGKVAVFKDIYGNLWDLIEPNDKD